MKHGLVFTYVIAHALGCEVRMELAAARILSCGDESAVCSGAICGNARHVAY